MPQLSDFLITERCMFGADIHHPFDAAFMGGTRSILGQMLQGFAHQATALG